MPLILDSTCVNSDGFVLISFGAPKKKHLFVSHVWECHVHKTIAFLQTLNNIMSKRSACFFFGKPSDSTCFRTRQTCSPFRSFWWLTISFSTQTCISSNAKNSTYLKDKVTNLRLIGRRPLCLWHGCSVRIWSAKTQYSTVQYRVHVHLCFLT